MPQHGGGPGRRRFAGQQERDAAAAAPAIGPSPPTRPAIAAGTRPCARRSRPHPAAPPSFSVSDEPTSIRYHTGHRKQAAIQLEKHDSSAPCIATTQTRQSFGIAAIRHGLLLKHFSVDLLTGCPSEISEPRENRTDVADIALRELSSSAVGDSAGSRAASALMASHRAAREWRPVRDPASGESVAAYRSSCSSSWHHDRWSELLAPLANPLQQKDHDPWHPSVIEATQLQGCQNLAIRLTMSDPLVLLESQHECRAWLTSRFGMSTTHQHSRIVGCCRRRGLGRRRAPPEGRQHGEGASGRRLAPLHADAPEQT